MNPLKELYDKVPKDTPLTEASLRHIFPEMTIVQMILRNAELYGKGLLKVEFYVKHLGKSFDTLKEIPDTIVCDQVQPLYTYLTIDQPSNGSTPTTDTR